MTFGVSCLLGTKFIFFSEEEACFVCFCRLDVFLEHERIFVNKTTKLYTFHNHKWISKLLHNRQEIRISLCWNNIFQDNTHLQWHLEMILDSFQKCKPREQTTKKGICLIFKRNIAHLAHRRALRTLIVATAERLKSLFVQAKFTRTLCLWIIHVPNESNSAIVIITIRGEYTTHRNCSQLFHNCLQRNIGFCRNGEFRDC